MARERGYQRHPRFTKRLEVTFSSGGLSYKGILSNLSANGLFIRTNRGFAPGTEVEIQLMMPGDKISSFKGIVRRTVKAPVTPAKNGMGIELITRDEAYVNLVMTSLQEQGIDTKELPIPESVTDFQIIACSGCGIKNKVSLEKLSREPKCGRCGTLLITDMP
ncbi:MAG TPA: PilZ domain-containing protein [Thermodesulfovibrionales bacterium]|nr:PilZ domain-containing protein [Thermodesulfovibrionales bacterium]